jgi:RNA polymerase sigma-70 factor (ECF subfamily)
MTERLHRRPKLERPKLERTGRDRAEFGANTDDRHAGLSRLMRGYLEGDERSFAELHRRLSPSLRAQIRGKISNPATAEDLLQATFLKAHGARERFAVPEGSSPDRAVMVWYSTIARNATIDHLRRLYRERAIKLETDDDASDLLEGLRDASPDAERLVLEREREVGISTRIRQALTSLPSGQRQVVAMHKLEGKTMAEISEELGVREGTIRVRAHRGYKTLATLLGGFQPQAAAA